MHKAQWLLTSLSLISQVSLAANTDSFFAQSSSQSTKGSPTVTAQKDNMAAIEAAAREIIAKSQAKKAVAPTKDYILTESAPPQSQSQPPVVKQEAVVVASNESVSVVESENVCVGQDALNKLRYVDIRDLAHFKTSLASTATQLIVQMRETPQQFLSGLQLAPPNSLGNLAVNARFYESGAKGPTDGHEVMSAGRPIYSIGKDYPETRKNSILGVEIESINEETAVMCDATFKMRILMFVHDESVGYFFRRLWVRVDFTGRATSSGKRFEILNFVEDISLNDTKFVINGDLFGRKIVMQDKAHNITKVFPVAMGAVDIKTDPLVLQDPTFDIFDQVTLTTDVVVDGFLKKTNDAFGTHKNSRSRVFPSYYSARPFIAVYNKNGAYLGIGMHYKITPQLLRGFFSHGCVRVRDQDLYQLDAIVNEGPHDKTEAQFLKHHAELAHIDHPMLKIENEFNVVNYKRNYSGKKDEVVQCKLSSYPVRYVNGFHTVADGDCLTMITKRKAHTSSFINFILNGTQPPPMEITQSGHIPNGGKSDNGGYYRDDGSYVDANYLSETLPRLEQDMVTHQRLFHSAQNHCQRDLDMGYAESDACWSARTKYQLAKQKLCELQPNDARCR